MLHLHWCSATCVLHRRRGAASQVGPGRRCSRRPKQRPEVAPAAAIKGYDLFILTLIDCDTGHCKHLDCDSGQCKQHLDCDTGQCKTPLLSSFCPLK